MKDVDTYEPEVDIEGCFMGKVKNGEWVHISDWDILCGENEKLKSQMQATCGVGNGDGQMFVHGDYDSIKAVQCIILGNEKLRNKNKLQEKLISKLADSNKQNSAEYVQKVYELEQELADTKHELDETRKLNLRNKTYARQWEDMAEDELGIDVSEWNSVELARGAVRELQDENERLLHASNTVDFERICALETENERLKAGQNRAGEWCDALQKISRLTGLSLGSDIVDCVGNVRAMVDENKNLKDQIDRMATVGNILAIEASKTHPEGGFGSGLSYSEMLKLHNRETAAVGVELFAKRYDSFEETSRIMCGLVAEDARIMADRIRNGDEKL